MRKHGAFPKDNLDDQENTLWGNHKEVLVVISQSLASCNQVTTNLVCELAKLSFMTIFRFKSWMALISDWIIP